jgi:hypothetical protein
MAVTIPSKFQLLDSRVTAEGMPINRRDLTVIRRNHNVLLARRARQLVYSWVMPLSNSDASGYPAGGTWLWPEYDYADDEASVVAQKPALSAWVFVPSGVETCTVVIRGRIALPLADGYVVAYPALSSGIQGVSILPGDGVTIDSTTFADVSVQIRVPQHNETSPLLFTMHFHTPFYPAQDPEWTTTEYAIHSIGMDQRDIWNVTPTTSAIASTKTGSNYTAYLGLLGSSFATTYGRPKSVSGVCFSGLGALQRVFLKSPFDSAIDPATMAIGLRPRCIPLVTSITVYPDAVT